MAIENLEEIKSYIESNKDNEEIKNYIGGFITSDRVENFLNSENGKKILQPKLDSYHSKSLESWKTNNIQKLVDEEVKKRFPEADPKDSKIKELELKFENMQKEAQRKELTNKALKVATEKKLPTDLIDFFISDNEENTLKNLEKLESIFATHVNAIAEERLKGGYKPPKSDAKLTAEEQIKAEMAKYFK